MKKVKRPNVFDYSDYRKFLRDSFAHKKSENRHFTYRFFAMRAGIKSSGALKEVVDGKKGLSHRSIPKYITPFGLNRTEVKYFTNLVLFNQSKGEDEKNSYFRQLIKLQRQPQSRKITPKEHDFYLYWYNSVIRELTGVRGFNEDPAWIADRMAPGVTPAQVRESLALLLKLGFLQRTEKGGLKPNVPKLDIDPDVSSLLITNFTRRMIELGWESLDRFDAEEREVSGLTLNLSRHVYYQVKDMARTFIDEVFDFVCQHPAESELVCRLNLQLFPFESSMERKK